MPFVSQKPLKKEVQKQLDQQFVKTVVSLTTIAGGASFLSEFLTKTEQIMFAKRLMIIFMLAQGVSHYRISKVVNVSTSTVGRTSRKLVEGGYAHVERLCRKKKNQEMLWQELEVIVRFGMPSQGKDRWNWLDELYNK